MLNAVPRRLRVDFGGDQFPVTGPNPRLSWTPTAPVDQFEIQAIIDGKELPTITVGTHLFVPWPWESLASRQMVKWRVKSVGSEWSEWAYFEAGLFDADWNAKWIAPMPVDSEARPAMLLIAKFEVPEDKTVRSARLYATALGLYEAFVNGKRAGTGELNPGHTSYATTLYAQVTDVTGAVVSGVNELTVLLSDGWYKGQVGAFRAPAEWGDDKAVRLELHVDLDDGQSFVVCSNETWTSGVSQITDTSLMDGETIDLRIKEYAESPVLSHFSDMPLISYSPAPPIRKVQSIPAKAVHQLTSHTWLADFGQNASGWVKLRSLGDNGTETTLDLGEHRGPDGALQTSNLDAVEPGKAPIPFVQRDQVISDGKTNTFEPRHTIHGFQYAQISRTDDVILTPEDLTMEVVHTDLEAAGTFDCSSSDLVKLWDLVRWSFRGNAVDIPTDCPTRERLGWTGDYQVFVSTAVRYFDVLGFSRKWLQSVRDDQLDDGRITNFAPDGRQIKVNMNQQSVMMTGSAGWGDAIVYVPWVLYREYGDSQVLIENWDAMKQWSKWTLEMARTKRHQSRVERSAFPLPHEKYLWDGTFHWGEWIEPREHDADGNPINPVNADPMGWFMADKGEVGTAFLYRTTQMMAKIALILGKRSEADTYTQTALKILDAWQKEFMDENGRTATDSQASYVRALAFGLVPDELRDRAVRRLCELVALAGGHLTTGFLSTADLLPVLADAGFPDVAYELLFQRTPPSWLAMVDRGATTVWEDWEGIDDDGNAHESLNHYSKGAVARFLSSHVLGIRQEHDSAAWQNFIVQPIIPTNATKLGLTWANGEQETPRGTIRVSWSLKENFTLEVDIPAGSTATVILPSGTVREVSFGHWEFSDQLGK